ncbi:MAG: deoxyguanosine kinase, partial [Arcticibacterium sp.]
NLLEKHLSLKMKPAINEEALPKYIAIEGPIGVGKTTLANKIAETFNYDAFLEQPSENPFLKNFYRNPSQSALATQLFFLFQRMQQIQDLKQRSLFETVRVADFLIEKDRLFAEVTLSNEEMDLYDKVYDHLTLDAPTPDLVIYLQAPIDVLKDRITKRGNINEQYLTLDYLEKLNDAYSRFFLDYNAAPLLIINAADIDLEFNENDYESLVTSIMSNPKGKNFINPQPSII